MAAPPFSKPTEVELWNPRATFRQTKDGNIYRVTYEVDKELWEAFLAPQPGMRLRGILWEAADDESDVEVMEAAKQKKKKEPEPKGPWGAFWQAMFHDRFWFSPGLSEVLAGQPVGEASVKQALHEHFGVPSLTYISPADLEGFCESAGLMGLLTMVRQNAARAAAKVA